MKSLWSWFSDSLSVVAGCALLLAACGASLVPDDGGALVTVDASVDPDAGVVDASEVPEVCPEEGELADDAVVVELESVLGEAVDGARVVLSRGDTRTHGFTNAEGCAVFGDVGPGAVTITVEADGFAPYVRYGDELRWQRVRLVSEDAGLWSEAPYRVVNAMVTMPEEARGAQTRFMGQPVTRDWYSDGVDDTPSADEWLFQIGRYEINPLRFRVDPRQWLGMGVIVTEDGQTTALMDLHLGPLPDDDEALFHQYVTETPTDETVALDLTQDVFSPMNGELVRLQPALELGDGGYMRLRYQDTDLVQEAVTGIREAQHPDLEALGAELVFVLQAEWSRIDQPHDVIWTQVSRGLRRPMGASPVRFTSLDVARLLGPIEVTLDLEGLHVTRLRSSDAPEQCRYRVVSSDRAHTVAVVDDFAKAADLEVFAPRIDPNESYYLAAECRRLTGWTSALGSRARFVDGHLEVRERLPVVATHWRD